MCTKHSTHTDKFSNLLPAQLVGFAVPPVGCACSEGKEEEKKGFFIKASFLSSVFYRHCNYREHIP